MINRVAERFLQYVSYPTMSDESSASCPSTENQRAFGKAILEELKAIGLSDAESDENGYVYATLPAKGENDGRTVGLIAHMDTSPDAPDYPVRPKTVLYSGEDIALSDGIFLKKSEYPALSQYYGKHLIVTDGKTLLGADDKAGLAEIITCCEMLLNSDNHHRRVRICITPDEEIGRGADFFDVKKFGADYAFTVDGGRLGGVEYENFNAASAHVVINGISIHPGDAKGKMKNASRLAMEFNAMLSPDEIPEKTEGYEGFHHLIGMKGNCEKATLDYIIRDHDKKRFESKKREFETISEKMNQKFGENTFQLTLTDSYYNMKEIMEKHMGLIDAVGDAMKKEGVVPSVTPIRGGTDGARLSFMGLPCPNLCTGGENYHSRFEYACVEDMETVTRILINLICGGIFFTA